MLILSTISLLLNNAITLRRILSIIFNRVTIILLLGFGTIVCDALYASYIETGFGIFSGLFHSTGFTDAENCLFSLARPLQRRFYTNKSLSHPC